MVLPRSIAVAGLIAALAGCSDGTTAPKGAVFGTFGGPMMEMTGTRFYVRILAFCSGGMIKGAFIAPDAEGRFSLPETPVRSARADGATIGVSGRVVGDRIDATVRTTSSSGVFVREYVLTRGARGNFSGIACLAAS